SPKKQPVLFFKYFWNKCFGKKKIIFNFYSREFTVAAYKQANLILFPSNVECSPIVLFECAAAKLPFLATDVGNSVEIAEWTKGGKILPTTKDNDGFSHAVIGESVKILDKMINDKSELVRMAGESHKIWKEKYSWEHITKMYERLYQDLIK
ncbi:MAG: glycosyltransferase, partial [Bacteroidia bacterium]